MATEVGKDIACTTGIRSGRYARGVELVAHSYFRRLTTTRGTLLGGEEEEDFGLNLRTLVGSIATPGAGAALPGKIENELMKDPRSESIVVTVTSEKAGPAVSYTIAIAAETSEGPFTLVLAVSAVSAEILGIQ